MEQFDQLLTCAICLDRYRNPKLLPCQHSFCMEPCMEGLINYVTRQVKCPECRAEHRIPYQGLSQYPTNVTLQRFLELHIEITGELPDPTSGQTMERCGVCSEKNYCTNCSHCDKKVCAECKESHLEIIKREIARVNNQIRRSIHRVQDALSIVEKNSTYLQQNCASVTDEIDEVYRRLSKALKDRTDYLKGEVEMYLAKEMSNLTTLRENLEQEVSNFSSNADFADKHMAESSNWEDNELMDAKDILLKTMEFIRNFECEPGDYNRRVRFNMSQDPHQLALSVGGFGELTINASSSFGSQPQPPTVSSVPGLMRSKSDHRVAAQFRQAEERYLSSCGSDTNEGRTSPLSSRRYFGDTRTPSSAITRDRYGSRRGGDDYDLESSGFDLPSDSRKSRFRSRFMRNLDAGDSDNEPSGRSVRFNEQDTPPPDKRKERERVLDTEDVTRGPLSGVTRFLDSPRVLKRLQDMENKDKRKETKPVVPPPVPKPQPVQQPPLSTTTAARRANRQVSEEDEIAKIKKQNKTDEATTGAAAAAAKTATMATPEKTRKTSGQATTPEERSHPLSPTSAERPKFPSSSEKTSVSRTTSSSSERKEEQPYEDPNRRRPGYLRSQSDRQGEVPPSPKTSTVSLPALETLVEQSASAANSKKTYTRTSSSSSLNQDDSDHASKSSKVGKLPPERLKTRSPSTESSTSNASSTRSSPARTGAAFSTEELKSRYVAPTTVSSVPSTVEPPRNRYARSSLGETSTPSSSTTPSAVSQSTSQPTPRFQSRFLGRAGTPSAEVSKVSESSSGSTSESESESEEDDDETGVTPKVPVPEVPDRTKDRELARTDIGPLLARSAQARDSCSSKDKEPTPTSSSAYSRTKPSTLGSTQATTPTTAYGSRLTAADTPSRYGTDSSSSTAASLARSRTGSSLAREDAEKYPLTSKYLNRSRANMADDSDAPSAAASSASTTSRYGGYKSRFLNRSRSSAALASENEGSGDRNGDYGNNDNNVDDSSLAVPSVPSALSGEERYPSGRSRYAALKERRSRLARSKSSHDVGPDDNPPEDSKDTGNSSLSHLPNPRPRLRSKSREVSPEHNNNNANGDGASLSSWARYLKSKYSTRTREPQDLDDQQPQRPRSRPPSSASNHDARAWSPDDIHSDDLPASPTVTTSFPRHQYLQKRNVQLKFGMRGAEPGCFTWPRGVAVGPDNTIVVADSSNHRVQVFDHAGQFLQEFGQYGNGEGEFDCLAGVAVNRIGQYIIADRYNHRIQVFDPSGRFLRMFGTQGTTDGKFSYPWGITTDALGFIYVCDKENHRVQVFQSDGTFVGKFGSLGSKAAQLEHPHYIAVSSINRVIVSDSNNHRIQIFDVNGKLLSCFGSEGAEPGQFKFPRGVAVDDQGYIIVADSGNNRIQIFTPEGAFLRTFGGWGSGDGEFKGLEGIAVMSNGSIVVCDRENHRIQLF